MDSKLITDITSSEIIADIKYKRVIEIEIERLTRKFAQLATQLQLIKTLEDKRKLEGYQDGILFSLCLKSELTPELIKKENAENRQCTS